MMAHIVQIWILVMLVVSFASAIARSGPQSPEAPAPIPSTATTNPPVAGEVARPNPHTNPSAGTTAKGEHHEEEGIVTLTPEAEQMAGIKVISATRGRISHAISLTGRVVANEDTTVHLTPKVEGLVRKVHKTLGDSVKAGEVLVELDSIQLGTAKVDFLKQLQELQISEVELERRKTIATNISRLIDLLKKDLAPLELSNQTAQLSMGEYGAKIQLGYSHLKLTKSAFDRQKRLFDQKVSSEKDWLESRTAFESAQAQHRCNIDEASYGTFAGHLAAEKDQRTKSTAYEASLQHLKILGTTDEEIHSLRNRVLTDLNLFTIRAPIDGVITEKHVTLGERATPEASLLTLSDRSTVWVLADVYEKDLQHVSAGMPATIEVTAFPGRVFNGKVTVVSPVVDPKTRTVRLRIIVDNQEGILPAGLFAKIETKTGEGESVISIPTTSVQVVDDKTTVFIREKAGRYRAHPVTTGVRDGKGERIEIFSGLKEGDPVVTSGSFFLRSEMAKSEMGHDEE